MRANPDDPDPSVEVTASIMATVRATSSSAPATAREPPLWKSFCVLGKRGGSR